MARRSASVNPKNPNSGNVTGPRTTPQVQDDSSARNRNTADSVRTGANVQSVRTPRTSVPYRQSPDRDSFDPQSALASNQPAHIINIGSPAVRPSRSIGSTSHSPQNTNTPDSTSATGTGQTPGGQFASPSGPSRPIARLRNSA